MKRFSIDPRLTLVVGNIVAQPECDAIVNSANSNLRLGSGVSGAIHTAAGPDLEAHCVPLRPLRLSQAIVTPGFRLRNPWIIHVRVPHYLNDADPSQAMVKAILAVLTTAEAHRFKKIAIPALGTGKFVFPSEASAALMVRTTLIHLTRSAIEEIRIVVASEAVKVAFQAVLDESWQR